MNQDLSKLYQIANKDSRLILGLMSGTSLDGLDLALCEVKNYGRQTKLNTLRFKTVFYPEDLKNKIREVFAKALVELPYLTALHAELGRKFAQMVNSTLKEWGVDRESVDLIASHGQTVMHVPRNPYKMGPSTLQIGEADILSKETGILCLSDFRQKHIAYGGEGAPLVVYGDYLLYSSHEKNQLLLNIGGIGNYTFLPQDENLDHILLTDTGPGNTMMDAAMLHYFGKDYDEGGRIARSGKLNQELWQRLIEHPFLELDYPKSTGPEDFSFERLKPFLDGIKPEDCLHTLCKFTAFTIEKSIRENINLDIYLNIELLVSGGGAKNDYLLELIRSKLPEVRLDRFDSPGISSDAKEASLFALLANEMVANPESSIGRTLGNYPWPYFGKISFPH